MDRTDRPPASFVPTRDHLPALDGLRGLAVLLVVWHHLPEGLLGSAVESLRFALRPGYLGVDVFFVLSGFLITRILLHDRAHGRSLRGFLFRRFARIFPIYYLTIGLMLLWKPGLYLFWCATYLCNVYYAIEKVPSPMEHTWSLAVEEHFYLVWPFLVFALPWRALRRWTLGGLLPLAVVLATVTAYFEPHLPAEADGLIYRITIYRVFSLGLGALLALHETWLRADAKRLLGVIAAFLVPALVIIPTVLLVDHQWVGPIMLVGFALLSGAIVLSAILAEGIRGPLQRLLTLRPLTATGRVSYGLYLYHLPIYFAFGLKGFPEGDPPTLLTALVAVVLSFVAAAVSYRLIEKPLLRRVGSSLVDGSKKEPLPSPEFLAAGAERELSPEPSPGRPVASKEKADPLRSHRGAGDASGTRGQ